MQENNQQETLEEALSDLKEETPSEDKETASVSDSKEEEKEEEKPKPQQKRGRKRKTQTQSQPKKETVDLSAFISNPKGNIYAVSNLPEEFIATLFAWVSRSPKSFKTHLEEAIKQFNIQIPEGNPFADLDKKAKDFHEKWTVGYGHSSVAENAVAHAGIEKVSRLASAELESANPFLSITEYSQRYQKPSKGDWHNPFDKEDDLYEHFELYMEEQFDLFEELLEKLKLYYKETFPGEDQKKMEKLAFEDARYVLPLAMHTQLGMTANARAWRDALSSVQTLPHKEIKDMADSLKKEITKVIPVLLKYTDPSDFQLKENRVLKSFFSYERDEKEVSSLYAAPSEESVIDEILAHYAVQEENLPFSQAIQRVKMIPSDQKKRFIQNILLDMKSFDQAPDAFRHVQLTFDLYLSEANWHQLLRHNRANHFSYARPFLSKKKEVPPAIEKASLYDLYEQAFDRAESFGELIPDPVAKEYIVLNGHMRRVTMTSSLWSLFHLINLRTSEEAQWDIRKTFTRLHKQLEALYPTIAPFMIRR